MAALHPPVSNLELEPVPVADLLAMGAPYNPRKISDHDLEALRRSLRFFGTVEPIVCNRRSNRIVGGHQRVKAAQAEGIDDLPVSWVDLDEPSEKQLNLALNRISGEWDDVALRDLLQELDAEGADLELTGFEDAELARLLQKITDGATNDDSVPSDVEKRCNAGDLWQIGDHRLLCGDATKAEDVARVLDGAQADTVTDPPYGIGLEYNDHDDSNSAANADLVSESLRIAPGALIFTPGLMNLSREMAQHPKARVLVWHKGFAQSGNGLGGASTWEPVLVVGVKGGRLPNDYLHFGTDREPGLRDSHPCPKPVALYVHLIEYLTGRAVYEPFCGSGTTLIACEKLARKCYALEISPAYCDVILQRWEQFTERKAERVNA